MATARCVLPFVPLTSVSELVNLHLSDASVITGFSQGGILILRCLGDAVTSS